MTRPTRHTPLRLLPLLTVLLVALAACGSPDNPEPVSDELAMDFTGGLETDFSSSPSQASTRAGGPLAEGTHLNLFGYHTGQNTWASAGASTRPTVMYNRAGIKTASGITYSPMSYWSGIPGAKYTFFAFAPGNDAGIVPATASTDPGIPALNVTVAAAAAAQSDLIAASAVDCTYGDADDTEASLVMLPFRHAMTRIRFSIAFFVPAMPTYDVKVTAIRLKGAKTDGCLALATDYTNSAPLWSDFSGSSDCAAAPTGDCNVPYSITPTLLSGMPPFYMIPQPNTSISIEMDYEVTVSGDATVYQRTSVFDTTTGTIWTPGKSILYQVTIQPSVATWKVQVETWNDNPTLKDVVTDDDVFV